MKLDNNGILEEPFMNRVWSVGMDATNDVLDIYVTIELVEAVHYVMVLWLYPKQKDVEEVGSCKYEITIDTIYGCPSGCSVFANSLCASQGLCGYDFGSNVARCFCYYGYTGTACERVQILFLFSSIYHYMHFFSVSFSL